MAKTDALIFYYSEYSVLPNILIHFPHDCCLVTFSLPSNIFIHFLSLFSFRLPLPYYLSVWVVHFCIFIYLYNTYLFIHINIIIAKVILKQTTHGKWDHKWDLDIVISFLFVLFLAGNKQQSVLGWELIWEIWATAKYFEFEIYLLIQPYHLVVVLVYTLILLLGFEQILEKLNCLLYFRTLEKSLSVIRIFP